MGGPPTRGEKGKVEVTVRELSIWYCTMVLISESFHKN